MRKVRFISVILTVLLVSGVWAQKNSSSGLQTGPFVSYNQGFGAIEEHELGNAVIGVDIFYRLLKINSVLDFGISGTADFGTTVAKKGYIDHWFVADAAAGIWLGINFNSFFSLRPEINYGAVMNIIKSEDADLNTLQTDQKLRAGLSFVFEPEVMKGAAIYFGANYQLTPEQENTGHFIGVKAGVIFRPGKSGSAKAAAEKKAE